MKLSKKHHRIALLSVSALSLASAMMFATPGSVMAASKTAAAPIKLVWTVWGSTLDTATYTARADLYHKLHPNVTIQVINLPNYQQQVETMIAGGKSPDIMNASQNASGFGVNGAMLNLTPLIQKSHFDLNRFSAGYLGEYEYHGGIYALPDRGGFAMIFYNKTLFKKAHLAMPTSHWTWTQFLDDAKAMTIHKGSKTVQWGFAGSNWWPFYGSLVHQAGGHFINASETAGMISTPATEAGLNFANDLVWKWHVSPTPVQSADFGANGPNFGKGNFGMVMDSFWDISTWTKDLGDQVGMAPMPMDKMGGMETVGTGVGIARASKNITADWQFLQWLSTPASQKIIVTMHEDVPATKWALNLWVKSLPKGLSYATIAPDASEVFSPRIPPTWTQLQTVEGNDLTPFWDNKQTVSQLAAKMDPDIAQALANGQ